MQWPYRVPRIDGFVGRGRDGKSVVGINVDEGVQFAILAGDALQQQRDERFGSEFP